MAVYRVVKHDEKTYEVEREYHFLWFHGFESCHRIIHGTTMPMFETEDAAKSYIRMQGRRPQVVFEGEAIDA